MLRPLKPPMLQLISAAILLQTRESSPPKVAQKLPGASPGMRRQQKSSHYQRIKPARGFREWEYPEGSILALFPRRMYRLWTVFMGGEATWHYWILKRSTNKVRTRVL